MNIYKQLIAISFGLLMLLPVMIVQGDINETPNQMDLSISTDKRTHYPGEIAVYTVKFTDSDGTPLNPDLIRATYDSTFIELDQGDMGVYTFTTEMLTQKDHQLGIYGEKNNYNFVQESLTLRPVTTQKVKDDVKVTAVQQSDILKFRISNGILSNNEIYKVRLIAIGATIDSLASSSWIVVPNYVGMDIKSVNGSIGPGEKQTIKILVKGEATMVIWNAYDIHGNLIYAGADTVVI